MQKYLKVKNGETIDNAIIIDAQNGIVGELKNINTLSEFAVTKIWILNRLKRIF